MTKVINNIFNKKALTILELSISIIVLTIIVSITYIAKNFIESARITNAISLTSQLNIRDNDNLVLWLETSLLNKEKKDNENIKIWKDISKNSITFQAKTTPPILKKTKTFDGIKGIYFDGSNYFESDNPLNLKKYTVFIVSKPDNTDSSSLFETGFKIKSNEILNNKIVVIKNDGIKKYIKKGNTKNFEEITNSDILNNRPSKFYIGNNGFKGEILEIIIFDKILTNKEIVKIENYLYNKYMR